MEFTEKVYLDNNPFGEAGRDEDVRQYEWKLVRTRKPHDCMLGELVGRGQHEIPKGELVMREHAIVEGEWGSAYSCLECMDKWLIKEGLIDELEETIV
jgi:hypothetical protein